MKKGDNYLYFCGGSELKNTEIKISLPPDIAFRLEYLAREAGTSLEEYIGFIIKQKTEDVFAENRNFYKTLF